MNITTNMVRIFQNQSRKAKHLERKIPRFISNRNSNRISILFFALTAKDCWSGLKITLAHYENCCRNIKPGDRFFFSLIIYLIILNY
jgi:hypothetical protein